MIFLVFKILAWCADMRFLLWCAKIWAHFRWCANLREFWSQMAGVRKKNYDRARKYVRLEKIRAILNFLAENWSPIFLVSLVRSWTMMNKGTKRLQYIRKTSSSIYFMSDNIFVLPDFYTTTVLWVEMLTCSDRIMVIQQ